MNDVENDDAPYSGSCLNGVGDDVRKTGNGFLECAVHSAFTAGAMNAKPFAGLPDCRRNLSRRFGVFARDMGHSGLQIVQRIAGQEQAASLAFRRQFYRSVEFIHGLIVRHKPSAFISASPRAMASKMQLSRST